MKNTNKIPTIGELREEVEKDNIEFGDYYELDEDIAIECLTILEKFPNFHNYLVLKNFDNYYLPTTFLAEIKRYVEQCLMNNNILEIKSIFNYLGKLEDKNDPDLSNVIYTGLLENYNKKELEVIWDYLPDSLKKAIINWPGI